MKEIQLKYGCNPNQKPSRIYIDNGELPVEVLNGRPGYINFLDALNGWQLVKELKAATGMPAATSRADWISLVSARNSLTCRRNSSCQKS